MKPSKEISDGLKKPLQFFEKYKFLLLIVCAGVLLLLLPTKSGQTKTTSALASEQKLSFSVEAEEQKMKQALSKVSGAGRVEVVLTLANSGERLFLQDKTNSQKTRADGEREQNAEQSAVIISRGSGLQETVLTQQTYPNYQGALVVCEGGGDPLICLELTKAVSALTGLGADKITVLKMGTN
ncbi:MAG: stage III sporulation protein AG [Oscillospiraceae bacterium]|jgi:stage III sporulation protein AG